MSCASDIVQLYGEYFQSLSPSSDVATMLQSGWSGSEHLPALVQEQCTHIMDALHAWLSIQCSVFGGDQRPQPQILAPVAVPLPVTPPQYSPLSGAVSHVRDRVDQFPQLPATDVAAFCLHLFQLLQRSPVHSLVLTVSVPQFVPGAPPRDRPCLSFSLPQHFSSFCVQSICGFACSSLCCWCSHRERS